MSRELKQILATVFCRMPYLYLQISTKISIILAPAVLQRNEI
jgi:hypothetical protein